MKREAQQKCSLFSEKSIFVGHRISLGLYYILYVKCFIKSFQGGKTVNNVLDEQYKGQVISELFFGVFKSPKKGTFFDRFLT